MTRLLALLLLALLAACATRPVRTVDVGDALAAQQRREAQIREQAQWSLVGRLAVSADGDGGSGRLEWRQDGDDFEIRLSAPVTRQSWRLSRRGADVRLEGLAGGTRVGTDAEALLFEATGWRLPVAAMAAWVRGGRSDPGAPIEFGPEGRPAALVEAGWRVEYPDWDTGSPARPRRVFAEAEGARVRLVIESWAVP